jgi:endonuclease YncB( thermonuclease family)
MFKYRAIVTAIADEETVSVAIDLGFGIVSNQKVKLAGIDTSDLKEKVSKEKSDAFKKQLAEVLLNKEMTLKSLKAEKSGRYLAFFYADNNQKSVNDSLVELGHAKAYTKRVKD